MGWATLKEHFKHMKVNPLSCDQLYGHPAEAVNSPGQGTLEVGLTRSLHFCQRTYMRVPLRVPFPSNLLSVEPGSQK